MNKLDTITTPQQNSNSVDLLEGWDTVYAIRFTDVNSAIAKAQSSPTAFAQTITDEMLAMVMPEGDWGESASASGTFGDWALTPGGAGHIVKMTLPVPTVTLVRPGHADQTRTDATFDITVLLAPVQRRGVKGDGDGDLFDLKIDAPASGAPHTITVQDCTYEGSDTDLITKTFLIGIMTAWLNENAGEFDHTFATVNLNARAAHDKFDWLMPTATSYAVTDDGTLAGGIFGVLCMTNNHTPSPNQQIMAEILPEGERSSFVISRERFLSKMLKPGMGTMFSGPETPDESRVWPDDYFTLTDNDTALTNTDALVINDFNVGGDDKETLVNAKLGARRITAKLEETYLNVHIQDLQHPYYKFLFDWWLSVHHTITSRCSARLKDGTFDLVPLSDQIGQETAQHEIAVTKTKYAKAIVWVEIFLGLVALVFPFARAGWLKYTAGPISEVGDGAVQIATVVVEGPLIEAEAQALATEGAIGVLEFIKKGLTGIKSFFVASFQSWHGQLAWAMTALLTFEQILEAIADKGSETRLPDYRDFAATVMAPIEWPEAASEYKVSAVQFNGAFQTFGDPQFAF